MIWSDHGTHFVSAVRELKEFITFFQNQKTQGVVSELCAMQNITWKFIPECTPHYGGLWEVGGHGCEDASETSYRQDDTNLRRICDGTHCLNSRPPASLPCDGDTIEHLTPGHFLIGRPLEALPDAPESYR